jgi:hypothetical protein
MPGQVDLTANSFVDTPSSPNLVRALLAERNAAIAYRAAHRSIIVQTPRKRILTRARQRVRSFAPSLEQPGAQKRRVYHAQNTGMVGRALTLVSPRASGIGGAFMTRVGRRSSIGETAPGRRTGMHFFQAAGVVDRANLSSRRVRSAVNRNMENAQTLMRSGAPQSSYKLNLSSRSGVMTTGFAPMTANGPTKSRFERPTQWRNSGDIPLDGDGDIFRKPKEAFDVGAEDQIPGLSGNVTASSVELSQALEDYFTRQARLPPSGATAFDPRLTPAWAGVKLPV